MKNKSQSSITFSVTFLVKFYVTFLCHILCHEFSGSMSSAKRGTRRVRPLAKDGAGYQAHEDRHGPGLADYEVCLQSKALTK